MQRNRDALLVTAGAAGGATIAALLRPFVIAKLRERLYRARFDQHASRSPILLRILRLLTADETRLKDQIQTKRDLPPAVVDEMLSRHEAFFGRDGHARVRNARVAVFGAGGVGSHCIVMLMRAGIKAIRIVDFDQVSASSLNRHAVATLGDVGESKVQCLKRFAESCTPFVQVDPVAEMVTAKNAHHLLRELDGGKLDLVIDCIDDVETKASLLKACGENQIKALAAMGAGAKADPTRWCVAPLRDAIHDPLATKLRWVLRGKGVDYGGAELALDPSKRAEPSPALDVTCVYSHEPPRCTLLPLTDEQVKEGAKNFGAVDVDHFRVRVLPVLGAAPAMAGHALAATALCSLAGQPVCPKVCEPTSKKLREKMLMAFRKREARRELGDKARPDECDWLDLQPTDIEFIVNDVWRGRCAVSRRKLDRKPLCLCRWYTARRFADKTQCIGADAVVLMAPPLADQLDAALNENPSRETAVAILGAGAVSAIDARLRWVHSVAGGAWTSAGP